MHATPLDRFFHARLGRRRLLALGGSAGAALVLASCSSRGGSGSSATTERSTSSSGQSSAGPAEPAPDRPDGWTAATHSNEADPDHATVFPPGRVNTMTLKVPAETWDAMLANLTSILGERGIAGAQVQGGAGIPNGGAFPGANRGGGGPGAGGPAQLRSENPDWFPATVEFNGHTWTNVGLRFKGNSSLSGAWRSGTDSIPFKLDFDEFEDTYPEIQNQRFYGFKQLSLANNWGDPSFARETVAYDLLEESGLVAAHTCPYEILLDRGEGPESLGIYTVIEVVDDTVVARYFEDDSGNIYEGDGRATSLAAGTESAIETSFLVEGGDNADWSDIRALYSALHDARRTTDPAAWRANLEAVFDVDSFLRWLGIAAAIGHWDTYGAMTHNFYLYNNPGDGRLTFISWDHNFVLGASIGGGAGQVMNGGPQGGAVPVPGGAFQGPGQVPPGAFPGGAQGGRGGFGGPGGTSLDRTTVGDEWPLISFLIAQPEYQARYGGYLREFAERLFTQEAMTERLAHWAEVIGAALPEDEKAAHASAMTALQTAAMTQVVALDDYLDDA